MCIFRDKRWKKNLLDLFHIFGRLLRLQHFKSVNKIDHISKNKKGNWFFDRFNILLIFHADMAISDKAIKNQFFFRSPYRWHGSNIPCFPWRQWSFDINEWWSLPESATKHCLIEAVVRFDTLFSVVNARWLSDPLYKICSSRISQWEVSRPSPQPKNSDPRSAHSTDFNILDFYFWAAAQNQDFQEKTYLNRFTGAICEKFCRNATSNRQSGELARLSSSAQRSVW